MSAPTICGSYIGVEMKSSADSKLPADRADSHLSQPLNWRLIAIVSVVFALGVGLRVFDIEADAPAFFADGSQDFTTDGGYLTLFAKNEVQFGQWSLFGYEHWQAFKTSLITGVAFAMYKFAGVSVASGAGTGVLLNCLALAMFLWGIVRRLSARYAIAAAVLLACNFVLILYGRFPFSENALLFGAGALFLTLMSFPDTKSSAAILGLLVSAIAFFCKAFGLLLLAAPIAWWITERSDNKWSLIAICVATTAGSIVALSYLFHGSFELASFLWTHGTEGHGWPHGLELPWGPFENLISYARTGLHKYTPILSVGGYIALLWSIFYREPDCRFRKPLVFALAWIVIWILVLSIFNYRPLRYQFVLVIPLVIVVTHWIARVDTMVRRSSGIRSWQIALALVLNWYVVYHAVTPFGIDSLSLGAYQRWVWYVLPVAVVLTGLQSLYFTKKAVTVSPKLAWAVGLVIVLGSIVTDTRLYYNWYSMRTYGIRDANHDMATLLGPGAVVSGQIGPAITCGNSVRAFPLFIKLPFSENEPLLRQYPVTHLAVPINLWRTLKKDNPQLATVPVVARFWIRDNINYLVPVWDLFGNPEAKKYRPTEFEIAARLMTTGGHVPPDSLIRNFLKSHPGNRNAMIYLYHWLAHAGKMSECAPIVETLTRDYPTDFVVNLLAAIYYRTMSGLTGDQSQLTTAAQYLETAVRYNPRNAEVLRKMYTTSSPDMFEI